MQSVVKPAFEVCTAILASLAWGLRLTAHAIFRENPARLVAIKQSVSSPRAHIKMTDRLTGFCYV